MTDKEEVWQLMAQSHPEFLPAYDIAGNYHAVREIVLGGSIPWNGVHQRFQPFKGAKVLDIGANLGIYSAYCAANGADVVAYEPHPRVFQMLESMVNSSGLQERVTLVNKAVWTYNGKVTFLSHASPVKEYGFMRYNGGLQSEGINFTDQEKMSDAIAECVTLDEVIGDQDFDCVKVDIEGAEFEIFLTANPDTLRRIQFAYVELHPWTSAETYQSTIARFEEIFRFEGAWRADTGRWEAVYLWKK